MTDREWLFLAASIFACLLAAIWTWHEKYRARKLMERMGRMIEAAAGGSFREEVYDESMLSSIEAKLAHYLAASKSSVQNLDREKEKIKELIADISHQTKTPVANILLYTQLLSEKELQKENMECVRALNRQAEKLNFLISSLVKISRLETGVLAARPVVGLVLPLMEEVIAQIAPKAKEKQIRIELNPKNLQACDAEGVGIGLFLAREIIAKENGYIKVKSEEGKGSAFFVYLPRTARENKILQNC